MARASTTSLVAKPPPPKKNHPKNHPKLLQCGAFGGGGGARRKGRSQEKGAEPEWKKKKKKKKKKRKRKKMAAFLRWSGRDEGPSFWLLGHGSETGAVGVGHQQLEQIMGTSAVALLFDVLTWPPFGSSLKFLPWGSSGISWDPWSVPRDFLGFSQDSGGFHGILARIFMGFRAILVGFSGILGDCVGFLEHFKRFRGILKVFLGILSESLRMLGDCVGSFRAF